MMLDDSGRLVFLDFGLMSTVEADIMEAFASGIQAVLNKDWPALTEAFIATGFFGTPIMYRPTQLDPWRPGTKEAVTEELAMRMEQTEGGLSRFGALSTVLFDMSDRWEEFTPPYSATRSLIRSATRRIVATWAGSVRSTNGRMCRQPTEQWP